MTSSRRRFRIVSALRLASTILAVAQPLDDERDRNVVDDEFEEFLGALDLARQLPASVTSSNRVTRNSGSLLVIARDHAVAPAMRCLPPRSTRIRVRICRSATRSPLDPPASTACAAVGVKNLSARLPTIWSRADTRELLKRAIGQNVTAIVDALDGDADRNVVDHRFKEVLGGRKLPRQIALLGAILMGGNNAAIRQSRCLTRIERPSVRSQMKPSRTYRPAAVIILDDPIERSALLAQIDAVRGRSCRADIGTRQPVNFEIAVVAEHEALARIDHDDAVGHVVQRR